MQLPSFHVPPYMMGDTSPFWPKPCNDHEIPAAQLLPLPNPCATMPISTRLYDANHLALGLRAESGVVAEQFDDIILKRACFASVKMRLFAA